MSKEVRISYLYLYHRKKNGILADEDFEDKETIDFDMSHLGRKIVNNEVEPNGTQS